MGTYTIGEVAERSGFSASALRYYEGIGLVAPADRTDAGYRLYDDRTLARLAFIARVKRLGCTLGEIRDLTGIWDDERCGPVQRHLRGLVGDKINHAEREIATLESLAAELREAAARLIGEPVDGPCDDTCACLAAASSGGPAAAPPGQPVACTLDPSELPDRVAAWRSALVGALSRSTLPDGRVRIELGPTADVEGLARLVAAEQACCPFFSFAITVDAGGIGLEVQTPDGAADLVDALLGQPPDDAAAPAEPFR